MDKCPNYNFRIERKGEQACSRRRATSWITEVTLWCGAKKHSTKEHGVFVVDPDQTRCYSYPNSVHNELLFSGDISVGAVRCPPKLVPMPPLHCTSAFAAAYLQELLVVRHELNSLDRTSARFRNAARRRLMFHEALFVQRIEG